MNFLEIVTFLVERRKMLGVSQRELAKLCGISVHALSNFESGKRNPTVDVLFRIVDTLGARLKVEVEQM